MPDVKSTDVPQGDPIENEWEMLHFRHNMRFGVNTAWVVGASITSFQKDGSWINLDNYKPTDHMHSGVNTAFRNISRSK